VEVAVELPFTIVFEPPSRSELRALLRMRGRWVAGSIIPLTIGTAYLLANVAQADVGAHAAGVPLAVSSQPSGALMWLDGQERGSTPSLMNVAPGTHTLRLETRDALESQYAVQVGAEGAALDAQLWRRQPRLTRLRAALPGASLDEVSLLEDGQLGLSIGLAPGQQLQAWRLDPRDGALEPLLTNAAGARLAFAADGQHLAYIGPDMGPPPPRSVTFGESEQPGSVAWLSGGDHATAPSVGWRAPLEPYERLVDVSWSPRADRLLVVSKQTLAGVGARSRAWLIDADAQHVQPLLSLPSGILPGSELWSPDGRAVAFVAHAGAVNALCLLQVDGAFHYLADLDESATPLLTYPPMAWSVDGQRLVFVAPHQRPPGAPIGWFQTNPAHALYLATFDRPTPLAIGDTDVTLATWREDGQLLGVARAGAEGPLNVRLLNSSGGASQQLVELPLRPTGQYAATWDLRRARLLVATQTSSGALDYWLVHLGFEGDG
jgi:hypothetical protein